MVDNPRPKPQWRREQRALELTLRVFFRDTLLLELYDFLADEDLFLKFVTRFGGLTVEVPTVADFASRARTMHICTTLNEDCGPPEAVERLATMYRLTTERVKWIAREARRHV